MATTVKDKKWYVVRAVSGQEAKIKDYIMSEVTRFGYDHLVEDILCLQKKSFKSEMEKK
jgi:transcriptional antiterminator NusG